MAVWFGRISMSFLHPWVVLYGQGARNLSAQFCTHQHFTPHGNVILPLLPCYERYQNPNTISTGNMTHNQANFPRCSFFTSCYTSSAFTEKMTCTQPQYLLDCLIIATLHLEESETQVRCGYGAGSCDCVFMCINWDKWWSGGRQLRHLPSLVPRLAVLVVEVEL